MKKNYILAALLILGFVARLYKIDNPIADWHSWRQADTSAVTRNFYKLGLDIFHPRYDDFSDVSGRGLINPEGYRFVEFPLYNIFHFILAKSFPFKSLEYWGRIVTILSALTSSWLIYQIVRRHISETAGFLSAFFYLFLPFNIYFTRVILPDPLMVTLYLASLYFFDIWIINRKSYLLFLVALFGSLAVLVKPVAIFFLLPVTWWFWKKYKFDVFKNPLFYALHFTFLIPFGIWRLWEHRFPQGIPASLWLLNGDHIRFKPAFWRWLFGERIGKMILGVWGIIPFFEGLMSTTYFTSWAVSAFLYLAVFAMGNVRHDYYQIPVIPVVCILLGIGLSKLFTKSISHALFGIFAVVMMLGMSWYDLRGNFNVNNWEIVEAGKRVDQITPKDAVVVAPYNGDTAFLYQTNRRGFAYVPFPIKDLIDRYNATYYVSVTYDAQTKQYMEKYIVVEANPRYVIIKLEEPKRDLK
jgi:hypothetical protein